MKVRIYSYAIFISGLILVGIGVYFFMSYLNDQEIIRAGGKVHFEAPHFTGKTGVLALLMYSGLVKTWWTPALIGHLGLYMIYLSFGKEAKIERQ